MGKLHLRCCCQWISAEQGLVRGLALEGGMKKEQRMRLTCDATDFRKITVSARATRPLVFPAPVRRLRINVFSPPNETLPQAEFSGDAEARLGCLRVRASTYAASGTPPLQQSRSSQAGL